MTTNIDIDSVDLLEITVLLTISTGLDASISPCDRTVNPFLRGRVRVAIIRWEGNDPNYTPRRQTSTTGFPRPERPRSVE